MASAEKGAEEPALGLAAGAAAEVVMDQPIRELEGLEGVGVEVPCALGAKEGQAVVDVAHRVLASTG